MEIKDIEMTNKNILELQKKLKKLKQEEKKLENKIKKFSSYDSILIGNILAKLMSLFEGIEYCCSKNSFFDYDYIIEPIENNRDYMYNYPRYKIKNINNRDYIFNYPRNKTKNINNRDLCYLTPSKYENKEIEYINLFIDYLYKIRSSKSIEEINNEELEQILKEFIDNTHDLQDHRKMVIEEQIKLRIKKKERKEFEKSCIIDRKLIFDSLTYIINHYEENISAVQEKEEKWSGSSQWSKLTGYHKLIVKFFGKEVCFKTEVDSEGCYPDEEYIGVHIDINKNTNICFFDIKRELLPILKNTNYAINFMTMIENLYIESEDITPDKIAEFLALLSNERKRKLKILKIKCT